MGVYAGKDGFIKSGSNPTAVTYIKSFNVTTDVDLHDVTSLGNQWKKNHPGLRSWSGNIAGTLDLADAKQKAFFDACNGGQAVSVQTLELGLGGGATLSGSAWIQNFSISVAVGDMISFTANFTGEDAPSFSAGDGT
ncbi:MAG: hypothetical protein IJS84_09260 [Spirochaetales bacterium]|nr:hypothetical protein [Spirochaetales bacterium]MBQ7645198.1 hypothetical protein [Spirochaetales bacterium]